MVAAQKVIVQILDEGANTTPDRVFARLPISEDVKDGFFSVTYKRMANAVDKTCLWMREELKPGPEEKVGYLGPNDLRYAIFALAVAKLELQAVMPLMNNSAQAQVNFLRHTACRKVVAPAGHKSLWQPAIESLSDLHFGAIPSLEDLLSETETTPVAYSRTWDEVANKPWFICQTSGTTGNPKPLIWTYAMLCYYLKFELNGHDEKGKFRILPFEIFRQRTGLVTFGLSWLAGLALVLLFPFNYGFVPLLPPASAPFPLSPSLLAEIHRMERVDVGLFTPDTIRRLLAEEHLLEPFKHLEYIAYAGAPLEQEHGDRLSKFTTVITWIGSTDGGGYPTLLHDDVKEYWNWLEFSPTFGNWKFEHFADDLYETVTYKNDRLEEQPYFMRNPDETVYHSNDLWRQHPTKKNLWKMSGRADDFVKLESLTKFNATNIEAAINAHPAVKGSLVGGEARRKPFVIIEPADDVKDKSNVKDLVWPACEAVNGPITDEAKLVPELVLIADPSRPFKRTLKGTISRNAIIAEYKDDIEKMYQDADPSKWGSFRV